MAKSTVVLVHGAWADGSSWAKVIPQLAEQGISAAAVQLPLTSFADDVAAARRAIDQADGPVVLAGHSYGGAGGPHAGGGPQGEGRARAAPPPPPAPAAAPPPRARAGPPPPP